MIFAIGLVLFVVGGFALMIGALSDRKNYFVNGFVMLCIGGMLMFASVLILAARTMP